MLLTLVVTFGSPYGFLFLFYLFNSFSYFLSTFEMIIDKSPAENQEAVYPVLTFFLFITKKCSL